MNPTGLGIVPSDDQSISDAPSGAVREPKATGAEESARERPPWNQELTRAEADRMLTAARAVGGDVAMWAVNVYYIQSALAYENWRKTQALAEIVRRHPRGCGVIHGNKPNGWTCLDEQEHAREFPERYGADYGPSVSMGERRCDVCVARAALDTEERAAQPATTPSTDLPISESAAAVSNGSGSPAGGTT